jgi:hypothetical protein
MPGYGRLPFASWKSISSCSVTSIGKGAIVLSFLASRAAVYAGGRATESRRSSHATFVTFQAVSSTISAPFASFGMLFFSKTGLNGRDPYSSVRRPSTSANTSVPASL